jgi:hypothetical protein
VATCMLMDDTAATMREIASYTKMSALTVVAAVAWFIPALWVSWWALAGVVLNVIVFKYLARRIFDRWIYMGSVLFQHGGARDEFFRMGRRLP